MKKITLYMISILLAILKSKYIVNIWLPASAALYMWYISYIFYGQSTLNVIYFTITCRGTALKVEYISENLPVGISYWYILLVYAGDILLIKYSCLHLQHLLSSILASFGRQLAVRYICMICRPDFSGVQV